MKLIITFLTLCLLQWTSSFLSAKGLIYKTANNIGGISNDFGYCIAVDQSKNKYYAGTVNNDSVDFDFSTSVFKLKSGYVDLFIAKYDSYTNLKWVKLIGGTGMDLLSNIILDHNDGVIVCGSFRNTVDFDPGPDSLKLTSMGDWDGFILKLDTNGNFKWAKQFSGLDQLRMQDMEIDVNNNIIAVGDFLGQVDLDPGAGISLFTNFSTYVDAFVVKLDSSGNFVWAQQYGNNAIDICTAIVVDSTNYITLGGIFSGNVDFDFSTSGNYNLIADYIDCFVLKLTPSGQFVWVKKFGGSENDYIEDILITSNGDYGIVGSFGSNTDFDPDSSQYILNGGLYRDGYILMLNDTGSFIQVAQLKNDFGASIDRIQMDANGGYILCGDNNGWTDFDPDTSSFVKYGSGSPHSAFIWFLTSSLKLDTAILFASTGDFYFYDMQIKEDLLYLAGTFEGTCDFNVNSGFASLTTPSTTDNDAFFVEYKRDYSTNSSTAVQYTKYESQVKVYPNPSTNEIHIDNLSNYPIQGVIIYSMIGTVVKFELGDVKSISLIDLLPGLYTVQIKTNNATSNICINKN
ncbi:MAG: T9SS type A sorting domain-containing protein [Chitinophagaceae bacterium]|nr:T9SS type A sorting domain-containing protein [Chitinophagaceae bacterium]